MSTLSYAFSDSMTMLRRNLRRTLRYPVSAAATVGMPIVFLLLFVYVFGDTMGAGLAGVSGGRDEYLDYVTPAIILVAVAGAAQGTAISVAMDMTEGIVNRFRAMAIARVSVLAGHVVGSLIQTSRAAPRVRADSEPGRMDRDFGLLAMITYAVIWLAVALGMVTESVEARCRRECAGSPSSGPSHPSWKRCADC
jgi:ABC-2 type transport system permease protein